MRRCCFFTPEGLAPERPWLDLLSQLYRVIAPWHPGYGASALIDSGAGGIDDLAYLYLDLATELELEGAVLVGADLGGCGRPRPRSTTSRLVSARLMVRVISQSPASLLSPRSRNGEHAPIRRHAPAGPDAGLFAHSPALRY
jgi:pimeloyl-ACP methyl ester carboxylesterase